MFRAVLYGQDALLLEVQIPFLRKSKDSGLALALSMVRAGGLTKLAWGWRFEDSRSLACCFPLN